MPIVIKKRVSLDFLGEEYKDAFIVFQAMPVSEYKEVIPKIDSATSRLKLIDVMTKIIKDKFISGKFPDGKELIDLKKEDLDSLDEGTLAECFSYITGQKIDPKV